MCLEKSGIRPGSLQLEFSEKILMEHREQAVSILSELRDLGVKISIDDFGTGYSSLNYLRLFPINSLKIDQSFISREDWNTTKLVSELGRALDMQVVAEGIETSEQLAYVRTIYCDYAQGNYFSDVLSAREFKSLLASDPEW